MGSKRRLQSFSDLSDEQRSTIQDAIANFRAIEAKVDRFKDDVSKLDVSRLNSIVSQQVDGLLVTENTVRIHMDTSGSTADMYIYLLNKEGVTIDSFSDVDLNESGIQPPGGRAGWFAFMRELYESARRSAYGANKILDELLKSLKKD